MVDPERQLAREMLAELVGRPAWMADAACRESDLDFIPGRGANGRRIEELRALCAGCLCRDACLSFALDDETLQGVWAGTTAEQRTKLRKALPPRPIIVTCGDCGYEFEAGRKGVERCGDCSAAHRLRMKAEYRREYRKRQNAA